MNKKLTKNQKQGYFLSFSCLIVLFVGMYLDCFTIYRKPTLHFTLGFLCGSLYYIGIIRFFGLKKVDGENK